MVGCLRKPVLLQIVKSAPVSLLQLLRVDIVEYLCLVIVVEEENTAAGPLRDETLADHPYRSDSTGICDNRFLNISAIVQIHGLHDLVEIFVRDVFKIHIVAVKDTDVLFSVVRNIPEPQHHKN